MGDSVGLEWGDRSLVLNTDLVKFGAVRGVVLDPMRDPDDYPELHQLVLEFGKTMCQKYPIIFRDLHLINALDIGGLLGITGGACLKRFEHDLESCSIVSAFVVCV